MEHLIRIDYDLEGVEQSMWTPVEMDNWLDIVSAVQSGPMTVDIMKDDKKVYTKVPVTRVSLYHEDAEEVIHTVP